MAFILMLIGMGLSLYILLRVAESVFSGAAFVFAAAVLLVIMGIACILRYRRSRVPVEVPLLKNRLPTYPILLLCCALSIPYIFLPIFLMVTGLFWLKALIPAFVGVILAAVTAYVFLYVVRANESIQTYLKTF